MALFRRGIRWRRQLADTGGPVVPGAGAARWHGPRETGSAVIEFTVLAVLVMVPIAYVVMVLVRLHAATYGVVTAAREAGRSYVTADSVAAAAARARTAAQFSLADQGLPAPSITVECLDGACLSSGSRVRIVVSTNVTLPLVPSRNGSSVAHIPVSAVHEEVVDTYRQSP